MVYTMITGSWREIDIAQPIDDGLKFCEHSASAIIHSVLYWECYKSPLFDAVILSFDMSDESFGVISAPYGLDGLWKDLYWKAIQLKEELAIFLFSNEGCFFVWMLNAGSVDWSLKFIVALVPVIVRPFEEVGVIKLAGCRENGGVIYADLTSSNVKLFSYDLSSGEVKGLPFGQIGYYYQVNRYTEPLLAVKKNNQV